MGAANGGIQEVESKNWQNNAGPKRTKNKICSYNEKAKNKKAFNEKDELGQNKGLVQKKT